MKKYLYVALGGMIGAVSRFIINNINSYSCYRNIPVATLVINITGSFMLAFFLTVTFGLLYFDADIQIGISNGFFGAYTTFSAFCKETVELILLGKYFSAISYVTLSAVLGIIATYCGIILGRKILKVKN